MQNVVVAEIGFVNGSDFGNDDYGCERWFEGFEPNISLEIVDWIMGIAIRQFLSEPCLLLDNGDINFPVSRKTFTPPEKIVRLLPKDKDLRLDEIYGFESEARALREELAKKFLEAPFEL